LLFVANVLNGTVAASPNVVNHGTVVRFLLSQDDNKMPRVVNSTVIGSGFGERTDPAALVVGPTGVAVGKDGTLYVADSLANRVAAIPNALNRHSSAGRGHTVSVGGALNTPLGLAIAPNGDVLAVNANDGNLVELTPGGTQVAVKMVDISGAGAGTLFGLAVVPGGKGIYLVNDGNNTLDLFN
jgi:glucose/arabinose dehydrogenase